jgi:hypothetical protein
VIRALCSQIDRGSIAPLRIWLWTTYVNGGAADQLSAVPASRATRRPHRERTVRRMAVSAAGQRVDTIGSKSHQSSRQAQLGHFRIDELTREDVVERMRAIALKVYCVPVLGGAPDLLREMKIVAKAPDEGFIFPSRNHGHMTLSRFWVGMTKEAALLTCISTTSATLAPPSVHPRDYSRRLLQPRYG